MIAPEDLPGRIEGVVVGGSAGAIDALAKLLPALSPTTRTSFFVALHLPRERPSLLVDIFERRCELSLREAEDKEPVRPATVYFAPPDYHLLIEAGPQLSLSVDDPVHFSRPSIDVLFESAADVYGRRLLGIILSGANEDGTDGLVAVHRAGGVTLVQEPADAPAARMIESALSRCPVDLILPLDRIAALLRTLT